MMSEKKPSGIVNVGGEKKEEATTRKKIDKRPEVAHLYVGKNEVGKGQKTSS